MRILRVVLLWPFVALTGCASIVGIQRAETLGLGRSEVGAAMAATGEVGTGSNTSTNFYPRADLVARTGIADTVDVGLQLGTVFVNQTGLNGTAFGLDAQAQLKVQLTDNHDAQSRVVVSVAPTAGAGFIAGAVTANGFEFNATLPVLIGIKFGPHELILSPRVVNALEINTGQGGGTADLFGAGGSVGFAFRPTDSLDILPEVGFIVPIVGNTNFLGTSTTSSSINGFFLTMGVGVLFDFGIASTSTSTHQDRDRDPTQLF